MFKQFLGVASVRGRYGRAGLAYLVLGIACFMTINDTATPATATLTVCPDGFYSCQGICVPNTYICCTDGTFGDSSACCCCSNSEDDVDSVFCPADDGF